MAGSSSGVHFKALNRTPHVAVLLWCDGDREVEYGDVLPPGGSRTQETFEGHVWRLRGESGTAELVATTATDQELLLEAEGYVAAPSAEDAFYSQSVEVGCAGLKVRASEDVAAGAVLAAAEIAREMLRHSPAPLVPV